MHLNPDGQSLGPWTRAIDVNGRHEFLDFASLRRDGVGVVVVRAGRGTRQDERWIEHVSAAVRAGLAVGSYWHVYPSRAGAYRQAELWGAAVRAASIPFAAGHWADLTVAEGLSPDELGIYVDRLLRRMDALTDATTGVFTDAAFWASSVRLSPAERSLWLSAIEPAHGQPDAAILGATRGFDPETTDVVGYRLRAATAQSPGEHRMRIRETRPRPSDDTDGVGLELVPRGPDESIEAWRSRWTRAPEVSELQHHLNDMGANIVVDGIFGPATDAALRIFEALQRRDSATEDAPEPPGQTQ